MSYPIEEDEEINPLSLIQGATGNLQRVMTSYYLGRSVFNQAKALYTKVRTEHSFTITLVSTDPIYNDVSSWLLQRIPDQKQRSLSALTLRGKRRRDYETDEVMGRTPTEVLFRYDGSRSQTVDFDGNKVKIAVSQDNTPSLTDAIGPRMKLDEKLTFTSNTLEGRNAVIAFLNDIARKQEEKKPSVMMAKTWGSWAYEGADIPDRKIESVVLRRGQKEAILEDLRKFLREEEHYVRLGMPYHRGYLLHGPPGTGKTSIAKALASHLGLDVYYLPLPSINNDSNLNELMQDVKPRSILLIEDIDIVHGAKDRDDEHKGVSLSGLLNALDGFMTPHGLITIMTTNKLEVLDDALVRPGRIDRTEHITYAEETQVHDLIKYFLDEEVSWKLTKEITPAEIIEVILKNIDNKSIALKEIQSLI